jgi:hypothetical protein
MKFPDLIHWKYVAAGISQSRWVAILMVESGVCRASVIAAFKGNRVKPATARALLVWAANAHFVDLDEPALLNAPMQPPRPKLTPAAEQQ